ncbi:MAG: glycosyltransferase [Eubacteriales bacterium]|nr:glycosyltransferase [Eubacteriales bacterium]
MLNELKTLQVKYAINLFSWYPFISKETDEEKDSTILIYGDANLEFVNTFANRVSKVYIICEHKEWKKLLDNKLLAKNVYIAKEIIKETFDSKNDNNENAFEYVVVPTFSTEISEFAGKDLYAFIKYLIKNYTNDNGSVLLPFDNSLSIDVIAGKKLELDSLNFSYEDIIKSKEELKKSYKNSEFDLYFPLPEYKFPLRIYSEEYLPFIEDEDKKTRNLVNLGLFNKYASSYIIVFKANILKEKENIKIRKEKEYLKFKTLYTKFNANRNEKFALKTSIVEDSDNNRYVVKKALYEESNTHIENMINRSKIIKNPNIKMLMPIFYGKDDKTYDNRNFVVYPYLKGKILSDIIIDKIKKGANEKEVIEDYLQKIIGKEDGDIEIYNLDCLFSNIIVEDDLLYVIDGEWIDTNTTEVNFLRYRILKYFYNSAQQDLKDDSFSAFVSKYGINDDDIIRYESSEKDFQDKVHKQNSYSDVNVYNENSSDVSRFFYVSSELDRAREKIKRIEEDRVASDTHIMKVYNVLRLTQAHANNLQNVINIHERDISNLQATLAEFEKHESLFNKIRRNIKLSFQKNFPKESKKRKVLKYIKNCFIHPIKMIHIFFTKEGRNTIDGDFKIGSIYFDYGKLKFKYSDKPLVSIIIPCYNQIQYTYKCLISILETVDFQKTPYEIIIADDVSEDATKELNKYSENIIISRNETNQGFLKNCNNAAKKARGEYIVFLNNDTEVKTNWLSSLVDLIKRDPFYGIVGSKLIFPDGTLQEAGGIIWADGSAWNYGRGKDPKSPEYNYVREVDYISGASIMIKKDLWIEIGGFDERYAPAYCEDSDLAFEVRQRGYKVMYQPASEIIHYEGISNGKEANDGNIKKYQVINNEKLLDKWKVQLLQQYPIRINQSPFKARERGQNKKVILFIDHYIPTWDRDAGSKTTFQYMKMFIEKGYSVKFLGDNFMNSEPYGSILQQLGVEIFYGASLEAEIWSFLQNNAKYIDFVYLNRPHIATKYVDFFKENTNIKIIFYGHDLHFLREEREYELTKDESFLSESKYYKSLELSVMYKTSMNYYPSSVEVKAIKSIDDKIPVKAIRGYVYDKVSEDPINFSEKRKLLFVGGFAHPPNKDAMIWFKENILPRIKFSIPNIEVDIVGSHAEDVVEVLHNVNGINLLGYVSDEELNILYDNAKMVIAPLRFGAGVKGKIIEAFAKGVPVITTECGAEGIDNARKIMAIGNNAGEFADKVVKLYNDNEKLSLMSINERKYINENYTKEACWNIIKDDFI